MRGHTRRLLRDEGFAAGVRETDMHREMLALYSWELANCLTESGQVSCTLLLLSGAVHARIPANIFLWEERKREREREGGREGGRERERERGKRRTKENAPRNGNLPHNLHPTFLISRRKRL